MIGAVAGCGGAKTDVPGDSTAGVSTTDKSNDAAVAEPAPEKKEPVTLKTLTFAQPHEQEIYDGLIKRFQEKYPHVKVVQSNGTRDEFLVKLPAAIAAKAVPDVFYLQAGDVRRYIDSGLVLALDDYIAKSADVDINNIWPQALERYKYDGKVLGKGPLYALPKDVSAFAFAYNKDMFKKEGIPLPDPNTPYTYEEFISVGQKLTKDTDGDGKIDQWGSGFDPAWSIQPWIWNAGADFLNEDFTKQAIDTPEFISALQFFADMTTKYKITPSQQESMTMGYYQRWLEGRLGFFACGNWDVGAFNNPETLSFDWDTCLWPVKTAGTPSSTWTGSLGLAVSAASAAPQDALNLCAFLSVDTEGQKALSDAQIQLPNNMDYAKGEFKSKMTKPNYDVFFTYIEKTGRQLPQDKTYTSDWFATVFQGGIINVLQGKETAEEYCKKIAPKVQESLDKANAEAAANAK